MAVGNYRTLKFKLQLNQDPEKGTRIEYFRSVFLLPENVKVPCDIFFAKYI